MKLTNELLKLVCTRVGPPGDTYQATKCGDSNRPWKITSIEDHIATHVYGHIEAGYTVMGKWKGWKMVSGISPEMILNFAANDFDLRNRLPDDGGNFQQHSLDYIEQCEKYLSGEPSLLPTAIILVGWEQSKGKRTAFTTKTKAMFEAQGLEFDIAGYSWRFKDKKLSDAVTHANDVVSAHHKRYTVEENAAISEYNANKSPTLSDAERMLSCLRCGRTLKAICQRVDHMRRDQIFLAFKGYANRK